MQLTAIQLLTLHLTMLNAVLGISAQQALASQPTLRCPAYHYTHRLSSGATSCVPCTICAEGYGAEKPCTWRSDTVCSPCVVGVSYSAHASADRPCLPCTVCGRHTLQLETCVESRDTVCGPCQLGYFLDLNSRKCTRCGYCFPYKPGQTAPIAECTHPHWPRDFRCAPVSASPYPPPPFPGTSHYMHR